MGSICESFGKSRKDESSNRYMEIKTKVLKAWPKLAWYATWEKGGDMMQVFCGNSVEVRKDRLFEGAWDGDFEGWEVAGVMSPAAG